VYADSKEELDVRKYDAGQDKKESKKMNIEIDYDAGSGNVGVFLRFTMLKSKKGLGSECEGDESREIARDDHVRQALTKCLPMYINYNRFELILIYLFSAFHVEEPEEFEEW
jgi:hypothetical protein